MGKGDFLILVLVCIIIKETTPKNQTIYLRKLKKKIILNYVRYSRIRIIFFCVYEAGAWNLL